MQSVYFSCLHTYCIFLPGEKIDKKMETKPEFATIVLLAQIFQYLTFILMWKKLQNHF
jgi:hypothetical protein